MRPLFVLIIFFVFLSAGLTAKENKDLIKANYYYSHLAFHDAIPFYEKVADAVGDPAVFAQLGDCYRLTNNSQKAVEWYAKAVAKEGCTDATRLHYAQVLMQLMRYDDAKKILSTYHENNKTDQRVANLIAGCESVVQNKEMRIPSGVVSSMSFNTEGSEFAPTLWKGNLVFTADTAIGVKKKKDNWSGNSYFNIYSVTTDGKGHCGTDFNEVTGAKNVNIKYHDGPCTFTADGKQMYFTRSRFKNSFFGSRSVSNKDSLVLLEVMVASGYNAKEKEFTTIEPFAYNSKEYSVAHAAVSPNGNTLAFSSTMPNGAGGSDLYICKKKGKSWLKPVNAGKLINTEGEEVFPYWADNTTLCFSSDGHEGLGGLDIYRAKWDEKSQAFSAVENVGVPVNSSYDDISLALNADGKSAYFSSNRPGAKGGDNIYFFRKEKIFLDVKVTDSLTGQPIPDAKISLATASSSDRREEKTTMNGQLFTQLYPEEQYTVRANKGEYGERQVSVSSVSGKESDTLLCYIKLYSAPRPHETIPPVPVAAPPVENEGIMDSAGIQKYEVSKTYVIGHFDFNFSRFYYKSKQTNINVEKRIVLDTLAAILKRHPTMRIQVQAHTDCRGTDEYNNKLSIERALSTVRYLEQKGISPKRLEYKGFGKSMPVVECPDCSQCTEEQHAQNRVLEFKVLQL